MTSVPLIDLQNLTKKSGGGCLKNQDWEVVSNQIREALHNVGFMYLINHGIPNEVISANFNISKQFFELPLETKKTYRKEIDKSRNGWVEPGQELLHEDSKYEYRECFDITTKDHIFPSEIISFSSTYANLETHCRPLIKMVLRLLAMSLKLSDPDFFLHCCRHLNTKGIGNQCEFSMIYYPPILTDTKLPAATVRCAEHTDYEIMTFLFQNEVGGLEIKTCDGKWLSVEPIPNAILVNTGDLLEMWTKKYYKATLHRVIIPKTENERRLARYSFAYFIAPDNDTLVRPLTSSVINAYLNEQGKQAAVEGLENDEKDESVSAYEHIMKRVYTAYGVKGGK